MLEDCYISQQMNNSYCFNMYKWYNAMLKRYENDCYYPEQLHFCHKRITVFLLVSNTAKFEGTAVGP